MLALFGGAGHVVYTAPSVMETEIKRLYGAAVIGRVPSLVEHFYAISVEHKLRHPRGRGDIRLGEIGVMRRPRAGAAKV